MVQEEITRQEGHEKGSFRFLIRILVYLVVLLSLTLTSCKTKEKITEEHSSILESETVVESHREIRDAYFPGSVVEGSFHIDSMIRIPPYKTIEIEDTASGHTVTLYRDEAGEVKVKSSVPAKVIETEEYTKESKTSRNSTETDSISTQKKTPPLSDTLLPGIIKFVAVMGFLVLLIQVGIPWIRNKWSENKKARH